MKLKILVTRNFTGSARDFNLLSRAFNLPSKGNRLIKNILRKSFEEKYKHTKIVLNFVLKQYLS